MKVNTIVTNLECTQCHSKMPISRKKSHQKHAGHFKGLWCYRCKKKTKHRETDKYN